MNDWYYYYFSAIAQILACFLGLYGLFSVFRIQEIKTEMLGLASSVKESLIRYKDVKTHRTEQKKLINILNDCIVRQNIIQSLGMITDINDDRLMPMVDHYRKLYYFYTSFKKKTINASIFAAIIIVLSLLLMIVGQLIPDLFTCTPYNEIHILISIFVLVLTSISIFLFISILKKSMAYIKVDVPVGYKVLRRILDSIRSAENREIEGKK